jgi:hypothetical protein
MGVTTIRGGGSGVGQLTGKSKDLGNNLHEQRGIFIVLKISTLILVENRY